MSNVINFPDRSSREQFKRSIERGLLNGPGSEVTVEVAEEIAELITAWEFDPATEGPAWGGSELTREHNKEYRLRVWSGMAQIALTLVLRRERK